LLTPQPQSLQADSAVGGFGGSPSVSKSRAMTLRPSTGTRWDGRNEREPAHLRFTEKKNRKFARPQQREDCAPCTYFRRIYGIGSEGSGPFDGVAMRIVAEHNLTRFRQQLERAAQATPFKQLLRLLDYRRQAWAPMMVSLDVIVTFSWMAFLGYGLIDLIFSTFRMLG
jgi:hypothetical protein